MPTPFMCHECDSPTMNKNGICDVCIKELTEPTTADEFNQPYLDSLELDDSIHLLKKCVNELPSNLYSMSSRHVSFLKKIIKIIDNLPIPERMSDV